jgi:hypothetical protein
VSTIRTDTFIHEITDLSIKQENNFSSFFIIVQQAGFSVLWKKRDISNISKIVVTYKEYVSFIIFTAFMHLEVSLNRNMLIIIHK